MQRSCQLINNSVQTSNALIYLSRPLWKPPATTLVLLECMKGNDAGAGGFESALPNRKKLPKKRLSLQ